MCSEYGQYMCSACHICGHWTKNDKDFKYKCHVGTCPDYMRLLNKITKENDSKSKKE